MWPAAIFVFPNRQDGAEGKRRFVSGVSVQSGVKKRGKFVDFCHLEHVRAVILSFFVDFCRDWGAGGNFEDLRKGRIFNPLREAVGANGRQMPTNAMFFEICFPENGGGGRGGGWCGEARGLWHAPILANPGRRLN